MEKPTSKIIMELFESRGWPCDQSDYSMYNRFCNTYNSLESADNKAIFLKIASCINCVNLQEYELLTILLLKEIVNRYPNQNNVCIAPMKNDRKTVSSSEFVSYFCKSKSVYYNEWLAKKGVFVYGVGNSFTNFENKLLFLVDDYIGSGTTAKKAVEYYSKKKGLQKENIILCSFFASNVFLKSSYYKDNKDKIIFLFNDKTAKELFNEQDYNILEKDIHFHLNSPPDNRLGYDNIGSLITLIRTPNNSLPILWKEYKKGRNAFSAPFPRKRDQ